MWKAKPTAVTRRLEESKLTTSPDTSRETVTELGKEPDDTLRSTVEFRSRAYPSELIEYKEYYPWKARHRIDNIDTLSNKRYGFTRNELGFIINLRYQVPHGVGY